MIRNTNTFLPNVLGIISLYLTKLWWYLVSYPTKISWKSVHTFCVILLTDKKHPQWSHNFMMKSSNGNIFRVTCPLTRSFDVCLIWGWINDWVNNREAGNLRRHRAHYDVLVMFPRLMEVRLQHVSLVHIIHRASYPVVSWLRASNQFNLTPTASFNEVYDGVPFGGCLSPESTH